MESVDESDHFLPVEVASRVPKIFLRRQQDLYRGAQTEYLQLAPYLALLAGYAVHYACDVPKPHLELLLQLLLLEQSLTVIAVTMHPFTWHLRSEAWRIRRQKT